MTVSVILCTHNPRPEYLRRTLESLAAQTFPRDQWELLLIDNASSKILALEWDLAWHPNGRHIREERLGLTPARLRGVAESRSDLLVFVDDDNVLDANYLKEAARLSVAWPVLGAWGGENRPEFEVEPPAWTQKHWGMLALRQFPRDRWSNLLDEGDTAPCGAGMVVRKAVALAYAHKCATDPMRQELDRKGNNLASCGDSDLAATSMDMGLGTGYFNCLKLVHIMPANRLSEEYLLKLKEQLTSSVIIVNAFRDTMPLPRQSLANKILNVIQFLRMDARGRRFEMARRRGIAAAKKRLAESQRSASDGSNTGKN